MSTIEFDQHHLEASMTTPTTRPDPKRAIQHICLYFGLSTEELIARDRYSDRAFVRQIVYCVLRDVFALSFPVIGRHTGRDHTTVMSGIKQARAWTGMKAARLAEVMVWFDREQKAAE